MPLVLLLAFLLPLLSPASGQIIIDLDTLKNPHIDLRGKRNVFLKGTYDAGAIIFHNGKDCLIQPIGTVHIYSEEQEALVLNNCYRLTVDGKRAEGGQIRLIGGGLVTWGICSDLTIRGIDVLNAASAGIKIKNDKLGREDPNFRNITVEDCYIKGAKNEGIYLGFYTYYQRSGFATPYAHPMRNLRVLNNEVLDCGWDGIQVGCADSSALIQGNVIRNNGQERAYGQNFGLCVNSGFSGDIIGNMIDGPVQIMPYSHTNFRNNTVTAKGSYAIFIRTEPNYGARLHTDPEMVFRIENNTIHNTGDAVYLLHTEQNGAPVPIHDLIFTQNELHIGGRELRFNGDRSDYLLDN